MRLLKSRIKNNSGDMYIQMLICFLLFVLMLSFILQISNFLIQKMWIDDKLDDITKLVAVEGDITTSSIDNIIQEIKDRMGANGEIVFCGENGNELEYFNEADGTVQIGTIVLVKYINDSLPVVELPISVEREDGSKYAITTAVEITRQAISEVYYKPVIAP